MVVDGRVLADRAVGPGVDPRSYLLAFHPDAEIPPLDQIDADAVPMTAAINHGTWVARCACGAPGVPSPGCVVFLDAPLGWCVRCGNAAASGCWRPVLLPPADERAAIEAVLACRPDIATRNWAPGETVADLVAENAAHGSGAGV